MNLICINKSGSAEGITAEKIKGSLKIDDVANFDFGASDPYLAALLDQTFKMVHLLFNQVQVVMDIQMVKVYLI